jgi:peptidyl-prolyl cis-trans isomerase C
MKRIVSLAFLAVYAVSAQQQTSAPPKPAAATATPAPAASAPAATDADPVIAVVEGKSWKKSELERMVRAMGPNISRQFYNDKRTFLTTFGLMAKLAALAESEGLEKQDPMLWRLMYSRMLGLAQYRIEAENTRKPIMPEDQKTYYEEHKAEFSSAQVKVLYLAFNDNPAKSEDPKAKKPRTSAEADALAADIVKQARGGADFAGLVEKYSDDAESKAKKGDFPPIRPADNTLPAPIKAAIFALKTGQVSDPVKQAGGVWVFRMEEFKTPTYDEVKEDIFKQIQEVRLRQWVEGIQKSVVVEFKDQKYLDDKSPAQ